MNSRERVCKVLKRELPDRLPFNFWMDRDMMKKLDQSLGENFRVSYFGADVIETFLLTDWFPELKREVIVDDITAWQVKPMIDSILDARKLSMPDSEINKNYELIVNDRKKHPDKALFALITTPLDVLLSLRLFEGMFIDMCDYPDEVSEFLHRVGDTLAKMVERVCTLDIDVLYIAGDICSVNGPLMSEKFLRDFCFEPIKKMISVAKKSSIPVFYHTDGAVMKLLDLFVEYGIEGINPLQPHLNDTKQFKEKYGNKLLLYGGLDNCFTIADKSKEDVVKHVTELFEVFGKDGGLIASSHDIPGYVPLDNLNTMVETLKECVYYEK